MKPDDRRHLRDVARKYDLDLLRVTGIRNQADVAIAELAIRELACALQVTGDAWGCTTEARSMISVTARRREVNTAQHVVHTDKNSLD